MADHARWVGLRLGVRLLLPRSRAERGAVIWLVVGSAIVMIAISLSSGLLQSIATRSDVVDSRAPQFVPGGSRELPLARARVLDTGAGEATIIELGPLARNVEIDPPPGVPSWPKPGEMWLSPAAADLRDQNAYLSALVHGVDAGRVGRTGLRDPDDVVIVMGVEAAELDRAVGAARITGFGGAGHGGEIEASREFSGRAFWYLSVIALSTVVGGAAGLMVAVSRMADSARTRRLAVLQLLGAPLRTVRAVAVANATAWALVGSLCGIILAWPLAEHLSGVGMFGITWWPSRSFNVRVVTSSAIGVCLVAAWGGACSVGRDGWGIRRRWAERPLSVLRCAPLIAGSIVLAAVVATQAQRREVDAATPTRVAFLLLVAALLVCLGAALVAPLLARAITRWVRIRFGTATRVAAARVDHHVRETSRWGLALVLLVVVAGVVLGAAHSVSWESDEGSSETRSLVLPATDDLGEPIPPAALEAAWEAVQGRGVVVDRRSGRAEPLRSMADRRPVDLSYVVSTSAEQLPVVAGTVQRAWPYAPPLITDRNLAGDRGSALVSGTLLVSLCLAAAMVLMALGVNLLGLQDGRRSADVSLLSVGMDARQLALVRAWEVVLGAMPGPILASSAAVPVGVAVMHLDHTNVPIPSTFVLVPAVAAVVVLMLAAAAAATAPRLRDGYRRPE